MGLFGGRGRKALEPLPVDSESRSQGAPISISSPAAIGLFGWGGANYSGEPVNENSALGLSAVWCAVTTIASQLAAIPLRTYVENADGSRERGTSFLDNPAGPDSVTPFEWTETVALHMVLHGEAGLLHLYNNGGAIVGLLPVHPCAFQVDYVPGLPENKLFTISLRDGKSLKVTAKDFTHVVGPCTDGLRGMSPLRFGANSLGTALAGDKSAANMFSKGALTSGVLTPAPDQILTPDDVEAIQADLQRYLYGSGNAGTIPIINRVLQFQPWQLSNADAQWLESRQFSVEEVARWYKIPLHMLFRAGATSNWGTGIAEQNKNFAQYVLVPWGKRLTDRLSRLLRGSGRFVEFDFAGLEQGSLKDTVALLRQEVDGGLLTPNEARKILNYAPIEGGDELRVPSGVMLNAQLLAQASQPVESEEPAA